MADIVTTNAGFVEDAEGKISIENPEAFRQAIARMAQAGDRIDELLARGDQVTMNVIDEGSHRPREVVVGGLADRQLEPGFARVKEFFRPGGPTFISLPYLERVYIGRTLTPRSRLDAQSDATRQCRAIEDKDFYISVVGLCYLVHSLLGWLPADDPKLSVVRAYESDRAKWPPLRPIDFLDDADPRMERLVITPLVTEFSQWLDIVTPTDVELEKYAGLVRSAPSSSEPSRPTSP